MIRQFRKRVWNNPFRVTRKQDSRGFCLGEVIGEDEVGVLVEGRLLVIR